MYTEGAIQSVSDGRFCDFICEKSLQKMRALMISCTLMWRRRQMMCFFRPQLLLNMQIAGNARKRCALKSKIWQSSSHSHSLNLNTKNNHLEISSLKRFTFVDSTASNYNNNANKNMNWRRSKKGVSYDIRWMSFTCAPTDSPKKTPTYSGRMQFQTSKCKVYFPHELLLRPRNMATFTYTFCFYTLRIIVLIRMKTKQKTKHLRKKWRCP